MELNEMEKKMLFQAEGDCQAKVLNELLHDRALFKQFRAAGRRRKALWQRCVSCRIVSAWIWCGIFRKITGCPTRPGPLGKGSPRPGSSLARRNLKGHDIMGLERFDPEVKHMIVFDVLSYDSPVGDKGDKMRLFLTEAGYQKFLESQERGEVKLKNHAKVSGGHLHYDRRDRAL